MLGRFLSSIYGAWIAYSLEGKWRLGICLFPRRRLSIYIHKERNARVILKGKLHFRSHLGSTEPIRIILEEGSSLVVDGDFEIGAGSVIMVRAGGELRIGGRKEKTVSGMASAGKILVKEKVDIGHDVIMAWDVLISDSDWHEITGQNTTKPIVIEDGVWLSHHVSIHKGVRIETGSVIGAHSLVLKPIPKKVMAAGIPAKVLKENINWMV